MSVGGQSAINLMFFSRWDQSEISAHSEMIKADRGVKFQTPLLVLWPHLFPSTLMSLVFLPLLKFSAWTVLLLLLQPCAVCSTEDLYEQPTFVDGDIQEMKSLVLCLLSNCSIVLCRGHLLPIQSYLCCVGLEKGETGLCLINSSLHNPPLHGISTQNSFSGYFQWQPGVVWCFCLLLLSSCFSSQIHATISHHLGAFILCASSSCPII